MLDFHGLPVRQIRCCFRESLSECDVAPIAGAIDRCPACVITVFYIGPMFEEKFGYSSETRQTCNDEWSPIRSNFRPVNVRFGAQQKSDKHLTARPSREVRRRLS